MATLGNILARKGGTAMTGLTVKLTLAVPDPQGGAPLVEEADVLLLPVSEAKKTRALREAEAFCAKCREEAAAGAPNVEPRLEDELKLRFLAEAMRDLESRKYEAAPYLRLGHERTLAEARALLTKAEAAVGR